MRAENAVIMAAGTSSRFAPLSFEKPKGLITVKGEVLIERQIRQLKEAGIDDICIVTGYKAEAFHYLASEFGVKFRHNPDYETRNNNASIRAAEDILSNTYVCSADNYFSENPFTQEAGCAYYSAVYSDGPTKEWCLETDRDGWITSVRVGGENAWYMLGHTFWDSSFSAAFIQILDSIYDRPETAGKLWETIYMEHLDDLHMKIRKYPPGLIFEFDTLDELRAFDTSYIDDTGSKILKKIAGDLGVRERDLTRITSLRDVKTAEAAGFTFIAAGPGAGRNYTYLYGSGLQKD